jgi:hypothetical protein
MIRSEWTTRLAVWGGAIAIAGAAVEGQPAAARALTLTEPALS